MYDSVQTLIWDLIYNYFISQILGFVLTIVFFIEIIIYYRRVRKIRLTEVAYEGTKTRNI